MDDKKYRVLLETLKADILNGKYGLEHPLPSVRALVRKFSMSSATVLHAFEELSKLGLVCRRQVKALREHLKQGKPDAFVCGTDGDAAIFRGTLEKVGLSVPKNVLLAGFNDVQMAALLTPPLTTIRIPREEIAKVAFKRLLDRISDPSLLPITSLLPVELVVRGSTSRKGARRTKR